MKKIRILSLFLTMVFCVTLCLAACNKGTAGEHDHVWDKGVVTTEPTCYAEGVITYSCTVEGCKQTQTAPVAVIEHSWDQGEVATEPKCDARGEKTFKCTNNGCTATKKEPVDKTDHRWNDGVITVASDFLSTGVRTYTCLDCSATREESIEAHADFVEQFYTDQKDATDWSYGIATDYDVASGNVDFTAATAGNNVWTATGVEIGKGVVKLDSAKAAIVYTFTEVPRLVKAMFNVSFSGGVVNAYLVVGTNAAIALNAEQTAKWNYVSEDALDVSKGDSVYLILDAGTSTVEGTLSFKIYAPCLHLWQSSVAKEPTCSVLGEKEYKCGLCEESYTQSIDKLPHDWDNAKLTRLPTTSADGEKVISCKNCDEIQSTESVMQLNSTYKAVANFEQDFATSGDNNWVYGYSTDYNFDENSFMFNALNADGDAWKKDGGGIEIKRDWILSEKDGDATVGYVVPKDYVDPLTVAINFVGTNKFETRIAARVLVVGSDNNTKSAQYLGDGATQSFWNITLELAVDEGDTIYVILFRESDAWAQGRLEVVITERVFNGASFRDDFANTIAGNSNWSVGVVDYVWADENFNFAPITTNNGEAFTNSDPYVELKDGWMAANGMIGFAHHFVQSVSVSVSFTINCKENGECSIRWALKDSAGNIKTNNGKASWGGSGKDVWVLEYLQASYGDTLYILVNKEGDNDQSDFGIDITTIERVSFGNDFDATLQGQSDWEAGNIDYIWADEDFTYTQTTNVSNGALIGEPFAEIKGDFVESNSMVGLAYKFTKSASASFKFELSTEGKFAVRWALKSADGTIKTNGGKASFGGVGDYVKAMSELTVTDGDVLYVIVSKEGDSSTNQCHFNFDVAFKK